jgi:very-short-patch-repair endonuclease
MILQELLSLANVGYRGTVGVVTPFRQQMIHLKDALESSDTLPTVFKERVRLVVSTAHGFQGDERDLILFSLCSGPDLPTGAEVFLRENPNLFNVAVSRARAVLHIVGNRDWAASCGIPFIESLARRTMEDSKGKALQPNNPFQSQWEKVLADALREAGIDTVPQYPVAGRFLDLAILSPRKIDIEVDGESVHRTSGGGRKDDDHWRDLQLQSLGWQVCRFWVYELREGLATCVNKVLALVNC